MRKKCGLFLRSVYLKVFTDFTKAPDRFFSGQLNSTILSPDSQSAVFVFVYGTSKDLSRLFMTFLKASAVPYMDMRIAD